VRKIVHGFYPIGSALEKIVPSLEMELSGIDHPMGPKEYLSAAFFTALSYFAIVLGVFGIAFYRAGMLGNANARLIALAFALAVSVAIFANALVYPRWRWNKKKVEIDRNILFAARHLMIQTSAGVPLFDALVSISEMYNNPNLDYGQVSREFQKIVKEVRGGKNLSSALEESATNSPSGYYKRMLWQVANSNRAGANMGMVLRDVVDYLSSEQTISIRKYGSQLNPLAMFYMIAGIIAPTMGLVVLTIISSISAIPINETTFIVILVVLLFVQVMFIGLIKSRRPVVAF
jgi:flagellar protein FlaJ